MGAIKTEKLANGNIGLEIIYGGVEAPFGGIDSSMPPMYIDPKCQVDVQGFMIVENQLVAVSFVPFSIDIILPDTGFTEPTKMSGFGSFYTKAGGYQNFVLIIGDTTVDDTSNTATTNVALYVWPSGNSATPTPVVLQFTQSLITGPATPAITTVSAIVYTFSGSGGWDQYATINAPGYASETYGPYASTLTPTAMAAAFVSDINSRPSLICTATVGGINSNIDLTTIATGAYLNSSTVDADFIGGGTGTTLTGAIFGGGTDPFEYAAAGAPFPLSFVSEGENLYMGGPGSVILQLTNNVFSLLSQYVGANVLKKFGGSLIALGITPSPGTQIQSPEMVLAWSAASKFGIWNPTDASGNVTGAGFEQLDDIEDILTGGFVNSSTLIILRSKGTSYATLTGNGVEPFSVNHVDLAPEGEGCQGQLLSSQYGPIGFFVGNSNVYDFVQQAQTIGDKIKSLLFPLLENGNNDRPALAACKAVAINVLENQTPVYAVCAYPYVFIFNPSNKTWTRTTIGRGFISDNLSVYMEDFPTINQGTSQFVRQSQLVVGLYEPANNDAFFYGLQEYVTSLESLAINDPIVVFPAEEVSFGRDITIDGLLVLMAGTPGTIIDFSVTDILGNVILFNSFTLPSTASYDTLAVYQIYDSNSGQCTGTGKAPQLSYTVHTTTTPTNQLRIAKISMFGSFDPAQRPV